MKVKFLDLGRQPIANKFIESKNEASDEFLFNLGVTFDTDNFLVSLENFVKPELMFNENYVYHASQSQTMKDHFKEASDEFKLNFNTDRVLEIGSNDGVFLFNFSKSKAVAVEPCGNFARIIKKNGYKVYDKFWTSELASKINKKEGLFDVIYSANCMCHIQNLGDAFSGIAKSLSEDGVFIFEDPSLLNMINRNSYDQIYDEHAHIFSIIALKNLLLEHDLEIFRVESLSVHGGSHRVYTAKIGKREIESSVRITIMKEKEAKLDKISAYTDFAKRVENSKIELVKLLNDFKAEGKKIVSYGATSKSTTVFNYCKINKNLIDYIVDTTPAKQNKLSPGMHIPVFSDEMFDEKVDVAFLGAWNFYKEISKKEENFLKRGGVFVTHVPNVRVIKRK